MKNINSNEITLSKEEVMKRIDFLQKVMCSNNRTPNFNFVYITNLLNCISKCKEGYYDIKSIYDVSLEMLEALNINIDYNKAIESMYTINEKEIKNLPNIRLLDNSVHGILIKC